MYFVQKKLEKSNESNIFQDSEIFPGGFECVLVQMLLMQALFSVLFCIRRNVILPLSGDIIILCVGQIDLELCLIL